MPSHEWAKVEGDVATVGITDHAQVRKTKHSTQGAPQATETTGEGVGRSRVRLELLFKRDEENVERTIGDDTSISGCASMARVYHLGVGVADARGRFLQPTD